ncbi:MAG TPA: ethylbenzene dehydrogenase-related protein [Anaerolineales bacterium]|nr:ethylbenzene dehydrogenase-related protein [Anaerolineales bacterium]
MNNHSRTLLIAVLALGLVLTFLKVPLASSQGVTLIAAQVSGDLPTADFASPRWAEATAIEVPLSAQNAAKPMLLAAKIRSVTARALHNGRQIAILLEWADETKNDQMVRVQDFRDAVALQFPLAEGQPFFCMGQQGGDVNIWHWKADWQADIADRLDQESAYPDMYVDQYPFAEASVGLAVGPATYEDANYLPALAAGNLFAAAEHASPVEDLIAGGFGSLTSQPAEAQNVQGFGEWRDGKWQVIFSRDLTSTEAEDAKFTLGKVHSVAFAAWDGTNGERNGQKSTSQWVSLQLQSTAPAAPPAAPPASPASSPEGLIYVIGPMAIVAVLILGAVGALGLFAFLRREKK